jgi:hypothetical protein
MYEVWCLIFIFIFKRDVLIGFVFAFKASLLFFPICWMENYYIIIYTVGGNICITEKMFTPNCPYCLFLINLR